MSGNEGRFIGRPVVTSMSCIPRAIRPACAALALVVGACSEGAAPPAVTVVDSAGISIVTSTGDGWAAGDAWRLELDLEIGDADGPDAFGRLVDVAPRRAGGVWVLDAQARRVRGYDEGGREVLAFGRPGQGPGELNSAGAVTELPNGELLIGGRMPVELYRFAADGEPLGVRMIPPEAYREPRPPSPDGDAASGRPPIGPTMGEWSFAPDGAAFLKTTSMDAVDGDILRFDVVLRIASGERPGIRFARWTSAAVSGGPGGTAHVLQPTASWSPLPGGGVWLTDGATYEVRRYDGEGALRSILRRPGSRVALTEGLKTAFRESLGAAADGPTMLALLEKAVYPDSLPATTGLWAVEPEGLLWVGVSDAGLPLRLEAPNTWDVFAPDGAYLGRLPIPKGLRPTRITSGYVYGVWLDELEVTHARRYRIVRGE